MVMNASVSYNNIFSEELLAWVEVMATIILFQNGQHALMAVFVWLVILGPMKALWSFVFMEHGEQCVMMTGMKLML